MSPTITARPSALTFTPPWKTPATPWFPRSLTLAFICHTMTLLSGQNFLIVLLCEKQKLSAFFFHILFLFFLPFVSTHRTSCQLSYVFIYTLIYNVLLWKAAWLGCRFRSNVLDSNVHFQSFRLKRHFCRFSSLEWKMLSFCAPAVFWCLQQSGITDPQVLI